MVFGVPSPKSPGLATGFLLGLAALLIAGCSPTDPANILVPTGPVDRMEADLFNLIYYIAIAVFIVVEGILIYTVIRYRSRQPGEIPAQTHGNTLLEVTWTIIPCIILAVIAVPTLTTIVSATTTTPPAGTNALNVKVVGHQFWWEFDYPDLGIVTADELHIPTGTRVDLDVGSADVIHSFWVPKLGGHVQAIPNQKNGSWILADTAGTYKAECFQLCGASHANMRMIVVSESQADFDKWVANMKATAANPTAADAQKGAQIFATGACTGCHTIDGTKAAGKVGPNLTHIGSHTTLAGAVLENTPQNMAMWIHNPPAVKPGSIMPNLNLPDDQVTALVAYLESLK
jgi:cytochrome c oxidase subunit II